MFGLLPMNFKATYHKVKPKKIQIKTHTPAIPPPIAVHLVVSSLSGIFVGSVVGSVVGNVVVGVKRD